MKLFKTRRVAMWAAILVILVLSVFIAGCASTPPEQTYPILGKVIVTADLVRGSSGPVGAVCGVEGVYARGEEVVPRVKILDPKTEKYMTDKDLKSVKFFLKDGTSVDLKYGGHPGGNPPPPPTDFFWAGGWQIPANYPTGASGWWVEAVANDGRTGRYDPPNVQLSALTVVERPAGK